MALITCPECGREISDRAAACPNCGFPVSEMQEALSDKPREKGASNEAAHGIPTKEPIGHEKKKKAGKRGWIIAAFCAVVLLVSLTVIEKVKISPIQAKIQDLCADYGLDNAEIRINSAYSYEKLKFYNVYINCGGFSELNGSKMALFFEEVSNVGSYKNNIHIIPSDVKIQSDGSTYIYKGIWIYKDGEEIYQAPRSSSSTSTSSTPSSSGSSGYSPSSGSSYSTDSSTRHTNAEAFTVARTIVEGYLKAPSTAKFCKVTEATITNSGDKYTVKGWVDAQNDFGAQLRQNFVVTYTAVKKGSDIGYKNAECTFS